MFPNQTILILGPSDPFSLAGINCMPSSIQRDVVSESSAETGNYPAGALKP